MTCTVCQAKTDLYGCATHIQKLRDMLTGLTTGPKLENGHRGAGWLTALTQATHGQTRMGESTRKSTDRGSPMLCNIRASDLLATTTHMLATWIAEISGNQGIMLTNHTATDMAAWLLKHTNHLAKHPAFDEFYDELKQRIHEIDDMINRPKPHVYCGPCPNPLTTEERTKLRHRGEDDRQTCATGLTAKQGDTKANCWRCKTTHDVQTLIRQRLEETRDWLWNANETRHIMASIGEPIPERTWRKWRAENRIQSRNEWDTEPKYLISEVREIYANATRRNRTSRDNNPAVV